MSRLVVVSNRVADLRKSSQSGGLAVALADALAERGGLWFGWDGRKIGRADREAPKVEQIGNITKVTVPLSTADYREYYLGYSNSVLWPLLHYRLDLVGYQTAFFEGYGRVNAKFADALVGHLRPDDLIWVHDYHLMPLGSELRRRGCRQRIGFFLHIPFAPPDLLQASPNHAWLVDALLEYDLVGFQTSTDLANFRQYVRDQTGIETLHDGTMLVGGRHVVCESFPIGIDVEVFRAMAERSSDDVQIDRMRRNILGRKQIIGVDRLDYSKGLPDRLKAFDRLLEIFPQQRRAVTLLQIAPPTREDVSSYGDIRRELEMLTGAINGRYADFDWTPIRYIHRKMAREKLAGLYRASQVGFVTPLRDGMNLVAKEFVAAQDEDDPGVLVLSQFAGAAEEMQEALIVNPFDIDDMANSLARALAMPLEERQARHRALLERIRRNDASAWRARFMTYLENPALPEDETS